MNERVEEMVALSFREARIQSALRQADVASLVKVSRQRVEQWDSGDLTPTVAEKKRLDELFQLTGVLFEGRRLDFGKPPASCAKKVVPARRKKEPVVDVEGLRSRLRTLREGSAPVEAGEKSADTKQPSGSPPVSGRGRERAAKSPLPESVLTEDRRVVVEAVIVKLGWPEVCRRLLG